MEGGFRDWGDVVLDEGSLRWWCYLIQNTGGMGESTAHSLWHSGVVGGLVVGWLAGWWDGWLAGWLAGWPAGLLGGNGAGRGKLLNYICSP